MKKYKIYKKKNEINSEPTHSVLLLLISKCTCIKINLCIKIILTESNYYIIVGQEEMSFKRFLIWSSGSSPACWSGTIYAILKEGIIGNIYVKLFEIWTSD